MARILRILAVLMILALVALWFAPSLLLPPLAARAAETTGATLQLEGVRPAWPLGVTAKRARMARGERTVELTNFSATLEGTSGARVEASSGGGTLLLRLPELGLRRGGLLRLQDFPLEVLDGFVTSAFGIRGTADGVLRFGDEGKIEATVHDGVAVLRSPIALELPFTQLIVTAAREPDGAWRVDFSDLRGPPLSATAHGRIGAAGELALRLEISQLEDPAREAFASAGLPTGPLPYTAELGGNLSLPIFRRVDEPAQ
jgi:hypothetical protein